MEKVHEALKKSAQDKDIKASESGQTRLADLQDTSHRPVTIPFPERSASQGDHLDKDIVSYFNPKSFEAEQFRKLAANILFQNMENPSRCILITSATEGEGKSFLTANLAVSLAKSLEEPVLLMDCDLRKPRLHKMFGISNAPGLSDHFIRGVELSALVQGTTIDHLTILPAGNESFHSAELLSSKRMLQVLKTVKSLHKDGIILIDSPPPVSTAEPVAIAKQVDNVILVVKYGATPKGMIEDVIKAIGKEKILGVVLNRSNHRFNKYYRYSTYR